jgi:hypothetical protein
MKTILVPTEDDDAMASALETALILARRCDSYIERFALRWKIAEFVSADMMGALMMATNSPLSADPLSADPFLHKDVNYDAVKDFV